MLTRFLIVVLAILNVGVALWWLLPRTAAPVPAGASQSQVDALQAKVDAMPALAVVTDPAQAPAGTIAVVAIP